MRASWVIVLVAACGGGGVKDIKDPVPPPAATATCRDAGAKLIELVVAGQDPAPPDDAVNKLIALVEKRCETDGWKPEARTCFSKVKTVEDADACTKNLSEQELANLSGDMAPPGADGAPKGATGGESASDEGGGGVGGGSAPGGSANGGSAPKGAPPPPTRGAKPKDDGADPCDGGE